MKKRTKYFIFTKIYEIVCKIRDFFLKRKFRRSNIQEEEKQRVNDIVELMDDCRSWCSLIIKARMNAGFNSLKYPVTDVKVNTYILPEFREIIADECNIVGYMDIPPIEYDICFNNQSYHTESDGKRTVHISKIKSEWQDVLCEERNLKRKIAEQKKGT